jgi:hypothetical protein
VISVSCDGPHEPYVHFAAYADNRKMLAITCSSSARGRLWLWVSRNRPNVAQVQQEPYSINDPVHELHRQQSTRPQDLKTAAHARAVQLALWPTANFFRLRYALAPGAVGLPAGSAASIPGCHGRMGTVLYTPRARLGAEALSAQVNPKRWRDGAQVSFRILRGGLGSKA